ncbi:MAG: hypothetical protein RR452_10040, partial [Clostridia bacterium]
LSGGHAKNPCISLAFNLSSPIFVCLAATIRSAPPFFLPRSQKPPRIGCAAVSSAFIAYS